MGIWIAAVAFSAALAPLWSLRHPVARFEFAVTSIASDASAWIGDGASISTYLPEQPLLGALVTSADIDRLTVDAFGVLSARLAVIPTTYFSPTGDMPTQETIWQYPSYFVRLYVTSALECDGGRIDVHAGSYQDFRGDRLAPTADEWTRFDAVPFQSPARFLSSRP